MELTETARPSKPLPNRRASSFKSLPAPSYYNGFADDFLSRCPCSSRGSCLPEGPGRKAPYHLRKQQPCPPKMLRRCEKASTGAAFASKPDNHNLPNCFTMAHLVFHSSDEEGELEQAIIESKRAAAAQRAAPGSVSGASRSS